jgi:DNA-binding NarL/FixJ family response regulator
MRTPDSRDLARAVAGQAPGVKLVGLGLAETEESVLTYAEAGFAGYVPREAPLEDIVAVVRGIARGEVRYSRRIATALLRRLANGAVSGRPESALTRRETEIAGLIDEGLSNREIAHRLTIEVATVKNHVHHLLEKLQVHRRGEAAARLRRHLSPSLNPTI